MTDADADADGWGSGDTIANVDRDTGRLINCEYVGKPGCAYERNQMTTDTTTMTDAQITEAVAPPTSFVGSMGGRKFGLTVMTMLIASVLVWFGRIPSEVWLWTAVVAMTGYSALNVIQKVTLK